MEWLLRDRSNVLEKGWLKKNIGMDFSNINCGENVLGVHEKADSGTEVIG